MIFNESETDTILSGLYELQTNHEVNDECYLEIQKLINNGYEISSVQAEKYKDELGLNQEERLVGELARLQTIMMIFEDKEEYERAAMIQKKIRKINRQLNNGSGKY